MIITQKIGNLLDNHSFKKTIDWLHLEWYEAGKRILRKTTEAGLEISLKFLGAAQHLTQGDVLLEYDHSVIAVNILPTKAIVIHPKDMFGMAAVCYEIGNKHLPLFYEEDSVLVPFEWPLYSLLIAQGYDVKQEERKLLKPLKTTVAPDNVTIAGDAIFSRD